MGHGLYLQEGLRLLGLFVCLAGWVVGFETGFTM
jgi:hypothetical protein